jgi:hypothetical protein
MVLRDGRKIFWWWCGIRHKVFCSCSAMDVVLHITDFQNWTTYTRFTQCNVMIDGYGFDMRYMYQLASRFFVSKSRSMVSSIYIWRVACVCSLNKYGGCSRGIEVSRYWPRYDSFILIFEACKYAWWWPGGAYLTHRAANSNKENKAR